MIKQQQQESIFTKLEDWLRFLRKDGDVFKPTRCIMIADESKLISLKDVGPQQRHNENK